MSAYAAGLWPQWVDYGPSFISIADATRNVR